MALPVPIGSPDTPVSTGSDGSFSAGSIAWFYYDFPDSNGDLYDPSDIDVDITDSGAVSVETGASLDRLDVGQYGYMWDVPADTTPGTYTITLTYTAETDTGAVTDTFSEDFVIIEEPNSSVFWRKLAMRSYLESQLGYFHHMPVFDEVARFDRARTVGTLSFPRWNQPAGVTVRLNGDVKESGYTVDWLNGKLTFTYPLMESDEVNVSYNFRWFTTEQLNAFMENGMYRVNVYPPQTSYFYHLIPAEWAFVASLGALVEALRSLMLDLCHQEPIKVFGGFEQAREAFNRISETKKNYEEDLYKLLEQKKRLPYTGLTRSITVPEYTLPGGRSRWFRYLFQGDVG